MKIKKFNENLEFTKLKKFNDFLNESAAERSGVDYEMTLTDAQELFVDFIDVGYKISMEYGFYNDNLINMEYGFYNDNLKDLFETDCELKIDGDYYPLIDITIDSYDVDDEIDLTDKFRGIIDYMTSAYKRVELFWRYPRDDDDDGYFGETTKHEFKIEDIKINGMIKNPNKTGIDLIISTVIDKKANLSIEDIFEHSGIDDYDIKMIDGIPYFGIDFDLYEALDISHELDENDIDLTDDVIEIIDRKINERWAFIKEDDEYYFKVFQSLINSRNGYNSLSDIFADYIESDFNTSGLIDELNKL